MIFNIFNREYEKINDSIVIDLGCGTGSLLCGMGYLEP
jgi:predicted RNA methylase